MDFLKDPSKSMSETAVENKIKMGEVMSKGFIALIGVCFLVDYLNNDSLVRTIKCQGEALLWPMGLFAMKQLGYTSPFAMLAANIAGFSHLLYMIFRKDEDE